MTEESPITPQQRAARLRNLDPIKVANRVSAIRRRLRDADVKAKISESQKRSWASGKRKKRCDIADSRCEACKGGECLLCDGGECRCTCALELDLKRPIQRNVAA